MTKLDIKDCLPSRLERDWKDVRQLVEEFQRFHVFRQENSYDLVALTTGYVTPEDVLNDLTSTVKNGREMLTTFVTSRLSSNDVSFHDSLPKRNSKTFSTLYSTDEQKKRSGSKSVRPDRDIFRRVVVAMECGRDVNIDDLLQKELCAVPLSLATTDFALRSSNKAELASILEEGATVTGLDASNLSTCTIIDGMAMVRAMGKPPGLSTFADYADEFTKRVMSTIHSNKTRVDIAFDQYLENSVKNSTRSKRSSTLRKVRTVIRSRETLLPTNWKCFIEMSENKANLARFLSEELTKKELEHGQDIVISGGFDDPEKVVSTAGNDVTNLLAAHEEADTRILLHAADAANKGYQRVIIQCRDTDVLIMLLVFSNQLSQEVWMKAGTSKKPRYIKVHEIRLPNDIRDGLLAFHSVTGCDTTSQFTGIGKKTAWKVFKQCPQLLHQLGHESEPSPETMTSVEHFVCRLYDPNTTGNSIQQIRCSKFRKLNANIDTLPPTKDALQLHIKRANYQTLVWKQCLNTHPQLPSPLSSGWHIWLMVKLHQNSSQKSLCIPVACH